MADVAALLPGLPQGKSPAGADPASAMPGAVRQSAFLEMVAVVQAVRPSGPYSGAGGNALPLPDQATPVEASPQPFLPRPEPLREPSDLFATPPPAGGHPALPAGQDPSVPQSDRHAPAAAGHLAVEQQPASPTVAAGDPPAAPPALHAGKAAGGAARAVPADGRVNHPQPVVQVGWAGATAEWMLLPADSAAERAPGLPDAAEASRRQVPMSPVLPAVLDAAPLRRPSAAMDSGNRASERHPAPPVLPESISSPEQNRLALLDAAPSPSIPAAGAAKPALSEGAVPALPAAEHIATAMAVLQEFAEDGAGQFRLALPSQASPLPTGGPDGGYQSALRAAVPAVAAEIVSQLRGGNRQFEIRLEPPELGRIEVRLDFRRDGSMTGKLVVERPETLDLLMRDARALEKTLQSSGLKLENGALDYQLRDQSTSQREGGPPFPRAQKANDAQDGQEPASDQPELQQWRPVTPGGIDIRV